MWLVAKFVRRISSPWPSSFLSSPPCSLFQKPTSMQWQGSSTWVGFANRETQQKMGRGRGISFLGSFPGFYHWLCLADRELQELPKGWLCTTFSLRNPETAPTAGPFPSTDGNTFAATSSELLHITLWKLFIKLSYLKCSWHIIVSDRNDTGVQGSSFLV